MEKDTIMAPKESYLFEEFPHDLSGMNLCCVTRDRLIG